MSIGELEADIFISDCNGKNCKRHIAAINPQYKVDFISRFTISSLNQILKMINDDKRLNLEI